MTDTEKVKAKLEERPWFRERRFRSTGLFLLTLQDLGMKEMFDDKRGFPQEDMITFAVKYDSFRHAWCEVMRDYPVLNGLDYNDKKIVEQNYLLLKGYEPNYQADKKILNTL